MLRHVTGQSAKDKGLWNAHPEMRRLYYPLRSSGNIVEEDLARMCSYNIGWSAAKHIFQTQQDQDSHELTATVATHTRLHRSPEVSLLPKESIDSQWLVAERESLFCLE